MLRPIPEELQNPNMEYVEDLFEKYAKQQAEIIVAWKNMQSGVVTVEEEAA